MYIQELDEMQKVHHESMIHLFFFFLNDLTLEFVGFKCGSGHQEVAWLLTPLAARVLFAQCQSLLENGSPYLMTP